jgi:uncharacterized protein (TIGR00369 family)
MTKRRPTSDWYEFPPFQRHLGAETVEAEDGRAMVRFELRPEFGNRKGDVHGGILATLVDLAMSQAIRSVRTDLAGLSTINMTVSYLEPASGTVIARGKVAKLGGSIAFAEATCESEDGTVVVQASGAFRMIRHRQA